MKRAFTLIELLVVIAIIAILAAILFPVFAQAKQAAKQSVCLSSNKQIATATYTYTPDFDDVLPWQEYRQEGGQPHQGPGANLVNGFLDDAASSNWAKELLSYTKNTAIYKCPVAVPYTALGSVRPDDSNPKQGKTSYMASWPVLGRSMTYFEEPANTSMLQESNNYFKSTQPRPRFNASGNCYDYDPSDAMMAHNKGGHLCFIDGHAKYFKRTAVTYGMLGASSASSRYRETLKETPMGYTLACDTAK